MRRYVVCLEAPIGNCFRLHDADVPNVIATHAGPQYASSGFLQRSAGRVDAHGFFDMDGKGLHETVNCVGMEVTAVTPPAASRLLDEPSLEHSVDGYRSTVRVGETSIPDATSDEYADTQMLLNEQKTLDFVVPLIRELGAHTVLDVGCGVGRMVTTLQGLGLDSYGVDLPGLSARWVRLGMPQDRLFMVSGDRMRLPFLDRSLDFAFSLGAIEHVGTTDGNATRLPDYRDIRAHWVKEIFRTLKVGGSMLLAGPNRGFPIDVAHGLDAGANRLEHWLSARIGASFHRTWGEYFLWSYGDLRRLLGGCRYEIRPLNVASYLHYSRVPRVVRPLVQTYVARMPKSLLGTGFNPWMAALVKRVE